MPSSREVVLNLALSGDELKAVIKADVDRLLAAEGMLVSNAAFGKVAYTLALKLYLDNPFFPESLTRVDSQPIPAAKMEATPAMVAITRPPLPPSPTRGVGGTVLHRDIASPNVERVRLGIPIPVLVAQQDGTKTVEKVQYPQPDPPAEDAYVWTIDETEARRRGYNIIEDTGE